MNTSATGKDSERQKTLCANLVRYKSSRIYFARFRLRGKLIRRSLHPTRTGAATGIGGVGSIPRPQGWASEVGRGNRCRVSEAHGLPASHAESAALGRGFFA